MVQLKIDGTRKVDILSVVELPSRPRFPSVVGGRAEVGRTQIEQHLDRVGSKAYWMWTVLIYLLLFLLCAVSSMMTAESVAPTIWWPYNMTVNSSTIYIYADNGLGQFLAPLLPSNVNSPVPAWSLVVLQSTSLLFMIICVFMYEAVIAVGRVHTYRRRAGLTRGHQRMADLLFSLLGGINVAVAFFVVLFLFIFMLMLQADTSSGFATIQQLLAETSANDVPLIESQLGCVFVGRNSSSVFNATATLTTSTFNYWDEPLNDFVPSCAAAIYYNIAYVVRLKVLLLLITFVLTCILAPILAKGDHRLAVEMRRNPVFKVIDTPIVHNA